MSDRRETFLELIRENRARLRRIARAYAGGEEEAKDLHQEILLEAWRSLDSFECEARPGTWLYRVALNTALDHDRKRTARSEARAGEEDLPRGADFPRPDERDDRRRRVERLYDAVDRLDETDRALVLMYLDGCTYREMSEVMGITENYVGVKLHRLKEKLADMLTEDGR